ncbi:Aste57867_19858 [Aphanomyces stellatus]|uniref:Aste57867_19858 protein n=1 Tax=Aphanomyces stellatus TaxID=120398 RepID=A0A485LDG7_9STRA|nr:hypothetical protein As57867_019792 [Aphanomyces stellatus]VFT96556.1 Aste57867_19858 [Aphanomyces stellatus]
MPGHAVVVTKLGASDRTMSGRPTHVNESFIHRRMRARDPREQHRVSSALEKLFDLMLVVALSAVSGQFATALATTDDDHVGDVISMFIMMFFSVWNAWLPFVWFSSTYDVDDILYRVGTLGQMIGILLVADGIEHNMAGILTGYIVLRVFYTVFFRFRAAYQDVPHRTSNLKYGIASCVTTVGWVCQQQFATTPLSMLLCFVVLATCDLFSGVAVELTNAVKTPFHPHHISDRYAEFTIILFGEALLSLSHGLVLMSSTAFDVDAISVAVAAMTLLFLLWWLYFLIPFGKLMHDRPETTFGVGYGHFVLHLALAALAAGLNLAALTAHPTTSTNRHLTSTTTTTTGRSKPTAAWLVAVSIAIYLVSLPLVAALPRVIVARYAVVASSILGLAALLASSSLTMGSLLWLYNVPLLIHVATAVYHTRQKPAVVAAVN